MDKFLTYTGKILPLEQANIDTDQIIPKQFLKSTERAGFGKHLFHDWRYLDENGTQENSEFILNQAKYKGSSILITGENFGCGSSREHAPWALQEYGFKVIIASSFADIFYANCINIGMLPVILDTASVQTLIRLATKTSLMAEVNLESQTVTSSDSVYKFEINSFHKHSLLEGIDSIDWTLRSTEAISDYENTLPEWRR